MKKSLIIFCAIVLMSGATSCNDFLDMKPISDLTPEKYFNSASDLATYTVTYYKQFFPNYTTNAGNGPIGEDKDTDNYILSPIAESTLQMYAPGSIYWTVSGEQVLNSTFRKIRVCNYFFQQVLPKYEAGTLSGEDVEHYIGEMYFMRAYVYFESLVDYGDFPIITKVLDDNIEQLTEASKRFPRNEVARFIISDLDKAIELLGKSSLYDAGKVRITKDLALLLKSRVALFEGSFETYHADTPRIPGVPGWPGEEKDYNIGKTFDIPSEVEWFLSQAKDAALQVVEDTHWTLTENNHKINPNIGSDFVGNEYFDMFAKENLSSYAEVLFWCDCDVSLNVGNSISGFVHQGYNDGVTRGYVDSYLMANGLPIYASASGYGNDQDLADQFAGRDERLRLFVFSDSTALATDSDSLTYFRKPELFSSSVTDKTGYRVRKFMCYDKNQNAISNGNRPGESGIVLARSVEAWLNYIEADYMLNGALDANSQTMWRRIRERAGVDPNYAKTIAATNLSKENDWAKYSGSKLVDKTLFNIRRERRNEFMGEGMRKRDLLRWRSFDAMLNGNMGKYIVEGVNFWEKLYLKYDENKYVEGGIKNEWGNISTVEDSKYIRPYRVRYNNNVLYNGWTWHQAYYLKPLGERDLTLVSPDNSVENSVSYQNPWWPENAGNGAYQ